MDNIDVPETLDGQDIKEELRERYKYASDHYADWIEAATEDYRFELGEQWTEDELETLKSQSRPAMTFNRIKSLINLIGGYQRENTQRIKVSPEGGEDLIFSEVCDRALKAVDKWSHFNYHLGYLWDEGTIVGKSFIEASMDYSKDPIKGELQFSLDSYDMVLPDPVNKNYDLNRGEYVFKSVKLTRRQLKDLFPKRKNLIEGFVADTDDENENGGGLMLKLGPDNDYDNDKDKAIAGYSREADDEENAEPEFDEDTPFTLKEYWYKKFVKRYFCVDPDTKQPIKFEKKEEAEAFIADKPGQQIIERTVPEIWVADYCCGYVLQDVISSFEPHYSGFPIFRFMADWAPSAKSEKLRVQGVTRALIDPQKEYNKSTSQNLHILNTQANSGWIGYEGDLSETGWQNLEKMGAKPGIVVKTKTKDALLREILPKAPNPGMLERRQAAAEEFKQISGFNPDLLGLQEGGTDSGRAISLRIKQGVMSLVRMFWNFRYTKEIIADFILQILPNIMDAEMLEKILGQKFMQSYASQDMPQGLTTGHLQAYMQMISDHKYHIEVSEQGQTATSRYETLMQVMELAKTGMVPPTLAIDFMDMPNIEEVKKKVEAYQQQMIQMQMQTGKKPGA